MKKASKSGRRTVARRSTMRAEYDFSNGGRGTYAERFAEGTNLVLFEPDVAAKFPNAAAVNKALRELLKSRSSRRTAQRTLRLPRGLRMARGSAAFANQAALQLSSKSYHDQLLHGTANG